MAPTRYSLHYEDYSEHLMSRFGKLLQRQSLVDMTLMCNSHILHVHKAVIAASSAYFYEILQKQPGEPLIIFKMKFSVLKCLVEFMYCGKTLCMEDNLDELVSAAQFLKIKGLSKVTKKGLGINQTELPVFTPPVVVNRPPQSLIDLHSQDNADNKTQPQVAPSSNNQTEDSLKQTNEDTVRHIPFDIDSVASTSVCLNPDPSLIRPRRGRPSLKRPTGWEGGGVLGRASERALLRGEQDSRKAIHHLKHLQTKHMQDYMDRVTLSEAINSICNNDTTTPNNLNTDNIIYMDQPVSSNSLNISNPSSKELILGNETLTLNYYSTTATGTPNETPNIEITTTMSQYVNALKNAGLPTDLPILFESGDGSYINVNEQVLLDMVQSSEIQYEVIEQPNIIEKVADPSEIKSIDELSKSIERSEMLMSSKNFSSNNDFNKNTDIHEATINSLNEILPDNLEEYSIQANQATMDRDNNSDFPCIDSDMQFFTKSISEDVKQYYNDQQLNDARVLDEYCPASTSFDTSFSMSLLDTKTQLGDNTNQQYSSLNTDELKRNEIYDFSLQLPHTNDFKEDALDCLLSTPKHNENQESFITDTDRVHEHDEIMKDLMNIEKRIKMGNCDDNTTTNEENDISDNINSTLESELPDIGKESTSKNDAACSSHNLQWDFIKINDVNETNDNDNSTTLIAPQSDMTKSVVDLTDSENNNVEKWDSINEEHNLIDKENKPYNYQNTKDSSNLDENIPFAVGLLPLKQVQTTEETFFKRKSANDVDMFDDVDARCLKRKIKCKKV